MLLLLQGAKVSGGVTVLPAVHNSFITDLAVTIKAGATVNPSTRNSFITDITPTISVGSGVFGKIMGRTRRKRRA